MSHVVWRRTACSILRQRQLYCYPQQQQQQQQQQRVHQPSSARTILTMARTAVGAQRSWVPSPQQIHANTYHANHNQHVTKNHPFRVEGVRGFARAIRRPKRPKKCPWGVLGIVKHEATVADAKRAFLKIAMNHHPDVVENNDTDTNNNNNNGSQQKGSSHKKKEDSVAIFMGAREALDSLVKDPDTGLAALRVDVEAAANNNKNEEEERMTDAQFDAWFRSETGHDNPFGMDMDPATMMEVAEMNDSVGHGLDRDGGMWQLASLISANVKSKKDGSSPQDLLRLDAGDSSTQSNPGGAKPYWGSLRRRRR